MNTRTYLIILGSSFALLIIGAIVGNILESNGTLSAETIGPKGIAAVISAYFVLFCVMAFAIVPLAIRFFIVMQIKIGNGEFFLIKWFQAHEQTIVYFVWGMLIVGLGIIFSLGKDDILKSLK